MTPPADDSQGARQDVQRLRSRRLRLFLLASLWLMATATALVFLLWRGARVDAGLDARAEALPVIMPAPDFALTNRDGRTVTGKDLRGRPWVADFIFTRCPGVCPVLSQKMQELAAEVSAERVNLVSITVDPEHDTPEVLETYAEKHQAGENWLFLTGEPDDVYGVVKDGFKLVLDPSPLEEGVEAIVHSNRFVLVDAEGRVRGYYDAFDENALADLRLDLASLLES